MSYVTFYYFPSVVVRTHLECRKDLNLMSWDEIRSYLLGKSSVEGLCSPFYFPPSEFAGSSWRINSVCSYNHKYNSHEFIWINICGAIRAALIETDINHPHLPYIKYCYTYHSGYDVIDLMSWSMQWSFSDVAGHISINYYVFDTIPAIASQFMNRDNKY